MKDNAGERPDISLPNTETAFKRGNMKRTILVVDDEIGPRESLKLILKPFYHVELAEDGMRALEILEGKKIDLVTLDLKMPNLAGEELLKIIKRKNPEIDVIIISGNATLESAVDGIRYRATDFISKPFTMTHLLNTIHTVLDKKEKREELKAFLHEIGRTFGVNLPLSEIMRQIKGRMERKTAT